MSRRGELARGSAVVSVITFLGHLLSTGLKLLISRSYGLIGFGQYALIMAFSRFFSTVVQLGYHQSIVYFISKFRVTEDWTNARRFFVSGLRHIFATSILLLLAILVFQDILIQYIHSDSGGVYTLMAISAVSAIIAVNNFLSGTLRSLKRFREQTLLFTSSFPLLMILAILILKLLQADSSSIHQFIFLGISLNLILLVVVFFLTRSLLSKKASGGSKVLSLRELPNYSMPIWASSALQSAARSSDRIMLGFLSSISEVAIYGAGFTFSILFAFPLKAMGPVFQPQIVELYTQKDFEGINKLYNTMVRWSALFVIPAFSALLCFGDQLILIFGAGFSHAYEVMIVLSFAQMVSTIAGLAGTLLNMTEKQGAHAKINAYGFIIAIALNLLLIPKYGALGAALGTGMTLLITNAFRVSKLMKYYQIRTDYTAILWLLLKFLPLSVLTYWVVQMDVLHWTLLMGIYSMIASMLIYVSLLHNEKNRVKTFLRGII